jgi:hypothetical protein
MRALVFSLKRAVFQIVQGGGKEVRMILREVEIPLMRDLRLNRERADQPVD